jgi:hypothetical protein
MGISSAFLDLEPGGEVGSAPIASGDPWARRYRYPTVGCAPCCSEKLRRKYALPECRTAKTAMRTSRGFD